MENQGLTEASKDRLLALMRPADDVQGSASAQKILNAITDECDPVVALAFVFQELPWAQFSGPKTPANEFPEPIDMVPGTRDQADYAVFTRDGKMDQRLVALIAQIRADEPEPIERAKRAWAFLETTKESRVGRIVTFQVMCKHPAFVSRVTPFRGEPPHNEVIPDEKYDAILWRNRAMLMRLNGIAASPVFQTSTAKAAVTLAALAEIPDEFERAVVYGAALVLHREQDDPLTTLKRSLYPVLDAAARGEPCPSCGKVHW